jgi:hypothetical protein
MRSWISVASTGAALMMLVMPAQAAWKSYVNRELNFSFTAPGDLKTTLGTFRGEVAGPRETIVYRSAENNVE